MSEGDSDSRDGFRARYGPWALVAGAALGLGAEFARQIARRGVNVLLLDRLDEPLAETARRIGDDTGARVRSARIDLAAPDLLARVRAHARDLEIGLLVYNAAALPIGAFLERDLDDALRVVDVNCRGAVVLAHELGHAMSRRGRGGMVFLSSLSGEQGSARIAAYAASKAFARVLPRRRAIELMGRATRKLVRSD